jgi:hypothetical protein
MKVHRVSLVSIITGRTHWILILLTEIGRQFVEHLRYTQDTETLRTERTGAQTALIKNSDVRMYV